MSVYFFDSSAIVKHYVDESGSDFVKNLIDSKKNTIFVARITKVEVTAVFARQLKAIRLSRSYVDNAVRVFHQHLTNKYFIVEITKDLLDRATDIATRYALRGYDAVQLAVMEVADERISLELSPLTLVSADDELNDAAWSEGLAVENPNDFP
jgi:predicted nucleic acid-binding protein